MAYILTGTVDISRASSVSRTNQRTLSENGLSINFRKQRPGAAASMYVRRSVTVWLKSRWRVARMHDDGMQVRLRSCVVWKPESWIVSWKTPSRWRGLPAEVSARTQPGRQTKSLRWGSWQPVRGQMGRLQGPPKTRFCISRCFARNCARVVWGILTFKVIRFLKTRVAGSMWQSGLNENWRWRVVIFFVHFRIAWMELKDAKLPALLSTSMISTLRAISIWCLATQRKSLTSLTVFSLAKPCHRW